MSKFDASCMTILVQAAGGMGSWRMWHYSVLNGATMDDVTEPGFFGGMVDHIESNSIVVVSAPDYLAQLVLRRADRLLTSHVLNHVAFPDDDDAEGPHRQLVPVGVGQMPGPAQLPAPNPAPQG